MLARKVQGATLRVPQRGDRTGSAQGICSWCLVNGQYSGKNIAYFRPFNLRRKAVQHVPCGLHLARKNGTMSDKTPLEQAQQQSEDSARNLNAAREESLAEHSHTREQQNVDTKTDDPGGIGKSGQAPNPRTQPTRNGG